MFVNVESPHLGAGYLKITDLHLVFEEESTDRVVVLADLRRGLRVLRRAPPATFTMDTGNHFRDDEDPISTGNWLSVVNGDGEVLGFRMLVDPDVAWRQVEEAVQAAIREVEASTAPAPAQAG